MGALHVPVDKITCSTSKTGTGIMAGRRLPMAPMSGIVGRMTGK